MSNKKEIWEKITKSLESKLPKAEFNTWFSKTTLEKFNPHLAIIGVPNKFIANWLHDRYHVHIKKSFETVLNHSPKLHFSYNRSLGNLERPDQGRSKKKEQYLEHHLNPNMTFKRFIIGDCNRFACLSGLRVANRPADQYNPLYIFSEGCHGKTHLLNAIGNHVLNKNPFCRVMYVSSNTFTSNFTYSLKNKKLYDFREKYLCLDFLLFDDVHLLSSRKRTQEEFLSLFNSLYEENKQIVITGDRLPNQLTKFSPLLRSRLGRGLISEIRVPDQDIKNKIIKKKAKEDNIQIPDDVIFFLAKSNKDTKGLIRNTIRIETYASLNSRDINISMAKSLMKNDSSREIGIEDIKSITAEYFDISLSTLISNKKQRLYSYPRQLAMYLCRKHTDLSFKEIGDSFGNRDHSTVVYAVKRIEKYKDQKKEIQDDLHRIENLLG